MFQWKKLKLGFMLRNMKWHKISYNTHSTHTMELSHANKSQILHNDQIFNSGPLHAKSQIMFPPWGDFQWSNLTDRLHCCPVSVSMSVPSKAHWSWAKSPCTIIFHSWVICLHHPTSVMLKVVHESLRVQTNSEGLIWLKTKRGRWVSLPLSQCMSLACLWLSPAQDKLHSKLPTPDLI